MAQLQPNVVIVNRLDQDRCYASAIGTQGVGIDLIACQSTALRCDIKLPEALVDALRERFLCMGDARNIVFVAEMVIEAFSVHAAFFTDIVNTYLLKGYFQK